MRFFRLPDLGEGLQEAEIVEWHVQPGDEVTADQTLVVVETAKAMVEIPSPQAGTIVKCFGSPGDQVHINEPLVEFDAAEDEDAGTVVGNIVSSEETASEEDFFIVGAARSNSRDNSTDNSSASNRGSNRDNNSDNAADTLKGPRRAMAKAIAESRAHCSCVTLFDDADVEHWPQDSDVTVSLCQAIATAVAAQPILNAWFDESRLALTMHQHIDLAIAVNTENGLFAPVLRDIAQRDRDSLRHGLRCMREDAKARNIPLRELQGATLALSNFGMLGHDSGLSHCGRHATPMIIPPGVAIIGAGRISPQAVVVGEGDTATIAAHRILPLSLTFDHRAVTGAEAAVFMGTLIRELRRAYSSE